VDGRGGKRGCCAIRGFRARGGGPHFVIETWVKGSDCAFPGGTRQTSSATGDAGFDTHYMYWGGNSQ
jgi:hypothetical protein